MKKTNKRINVFCQQNPLVYERKSKFLKERPLGNVVVMISVPAGPPGLGPPAVPASSPAFARWKSLDPQASPGPTSPSRLDSLGWKYLLLTTWEILIHLSNSV